MLPQYFNDELDAVESKKEIQKLTFYPMMFQAARVLRTKGILEEVYKSKKKGIEVKQVCKNLDLPFYAVNSLLEIGLTIGLVILKDEDTYAITRMGYLLLFDKATIANLNFTHHVCYQPMFHLEKSMFDEFPYGLEEIGIHGEATIYPSLSKLEEPIKSSWFEFDHYYSDKAFPKALPIVFDENAPKHMLDIGGNTGKWSIASCKFNSDVKMTIVDLPGQLKVALENAKNEQLEDRIGGIETNVLSDEMKLPEDADAVWMSQFLDCFSYEQIVLILKNIFKNINNETTVYILETFWDRQTDIEAAYCLHGTTLYFSAVANGNSKMYHSKDLYKAIKEAGMEVVEDIDKVGEFHTLLKCKKINQ